MTKLHVKDFAMRVSTDATIPLCRCGSRTIQTDDSGKWRCGRGHFARPLAYLTFGNRKAA